MSFIYHNAVIIQFPDHGKVQHAIFGVNIGNICNPPFHSACPRLTHFLRRRISDTNLKDRLDFRLISLTGNKAAIFVYLRLLVSNPPDVVIFLHQGGFCLLSSLLIQFRSRRGGLLWCTVHYPVWGNFRYPRHNETVAVFDPALFIIKLRFYSLNVSVFTSSSAI